MLAKYKLKIKTFEHDLKKKNDGIAQKKLKCKCSALHVSRKVGKHYTEKKLKSQRH